MGGPVIRASLWTSFFDPKRPNPKLKPHIFVATGVCLNPKTPNLLRPSTTKRTCHFSLPPPSTPRPEQQTGLTTSDSSSKPFIPEFHKNPMGKKRKHSETAAVTEVNKEDSAAERPKRTLLGWKDKIEEKKESDSVVGFRNKEKVLVTCSRRISFRYRHLMLNVVSLLPHCKKDNKVESKDSKGATLNELVELKGCSSCLFFECRKGRDLYLWMAKCPNGPSVKFLVNAVHTMEELKLTGNHLKGSRPILTFSTNFEKDPHWKLLKEMIMQIFGSPKDHRKSKPYHDHVFVFSILDDHVWFRNYQISCPHTGTQKIDRADLEKMTLVEVGPRFCLNPIKIFGGSFGGPTLYENPFYVSPNQIRALEKKQKVGKYAKKIKAKTRRKMHELENPLQVDELAHMWNE